MGLLALGRQRLKRLAVLIDVQVYAQRNNNASQAYVNLIRCCIERILSMCNDNSTGHQKNVNWGFKLFDSSLSPLASSSMIQRLLKKTEAFGQEPYGRTKTAEEKLDLFQQSLSVVATEVSSKSCDPCQQSRSKCEFVIRALQELLSDFTWDSVSMSDGSSSDEDQVKRAGECLGGSVWSTQQNLVVVFSHLPDNMKQFADFMNLPISQYSTRDREILKAFSSKMKKLQDPFRQKGIHACWIDMPRVSTSLLNQGKGLPVSIGPDRRPEKQELHEVFALAKWKYTSMDALAIASDCIPLPILWSSVAYPDLQVRPKAPRLQAKLRFSIIGRDGTQLQPEVCKLEAVALDSNVVGSSLIKDSISAALKSGSSSTKVGKLSTPKCPSKEAPVVKIVVKSLLQKQNLHFRCSLRYLLYHGVGNGGDCTTKRKSASAGNGVEEPNSLADDASYCINGVDILQQLQQNPMGFEPGQRTWQVFLVTIARKGSVAEVDLYEDGVCSSAILEPISAEYAALLQKDSSSRRLSSDCTEQFAVQQAISKSSPLLLTTVESVKDLDTPGSECPRAQKDLRPQKRPAEAMSCEVDPPAKKGRYLGGSEQMSNCAEEMNPIKRDVYSWTQHWRHILRRRTLGSGKVKIENSYLRPGPGKKPSKAMLIIKCWLDQVAKPKPLMEQQPAPVTPVLTGHAESDVGEKGVDGGSSPVRSPKNELIPFKGRELFSSVLDTAEEADAYLSSIEQMLQDCLQSDSGDLLVFVKGIMSNGIKAQSILLYRNQSMGLVRPLSENIQQIKDEYMLVHGNGQGISKKTDILKPFNSVSSCNLPRVEKAEHRSEINSSTMHDMLCSASGVMNCAMPVSNSVDFGGASDGADCTADSKAYVGKTGLALCVAGSRNYHEPPNESQIVLNLAPPCDTVANQLMDKLLLKPKKLARKFTDCDSSNANGAHIRKEKLRAYELQILFRMEMIERDWGRPSDKEKSRIVKEICRLLDDIQFDLGGGVFGGESLHDYSIRVMYNRYKESLPQTIADIFERMEFNGYVEGVSDLQLVPADSIVQVGIHDQKDSEGVEITDQFATTDTVTGLIIPDVQSLVEKDQSDFTRTSSKGPIKKRRKRSTPMDAFTRASEKRKLASRLAHFGGPDSLSRLKKIKLHNQPSRAPKVNSPSNDKVQSRERNVVLETPRFERQKEREERIDEEGVESISTRPLTSTFGFGTPARVSKCVQSTTRKRRLALFTQKKPPGRGLPRIPPDVMMAMAEDGTLHHSNKSDHQRVSEFRAQNDCNEGSGSLYMSQTSHEQGLLDSMNKGQLPVDTREDSGATTFDPADLTGWVLRPQCDRSRPAKNVPGILGCAGSETLDSAGQALSISKINEENSCQAACATPAEAAVNYQVNDIKHATSADTRSVPSRRNRRKSLYTSKSRKPDDLAVFSQAPNSPTGTQTLSLQIKERNSPRTGHATQDLERTAQPLRKADGSQSIDLASSENRWNIEDISLSSPTEEPMNCVSGFKSAQGMEEETEVAEVAEETEVNSLSCRVENKHGFLRASHSEELTSSSLPTASFTNCSELDGDTEVLLQTQIVEEVWNHECPTVSNLRTSSSTRIPDEVMLCLSPSKSLNTWDVPCTDLSKSPNSEQVVRTGASRMSPSPTKSDSLRIRSRHAGSPLLINRTSKVCRILSSPLAHKPAIEDDLKSLKTSDLSSEDLTGDLDFSQVINEIFQSTKGTERKCVDEQQELTVHEDVDWLDDLPELNGVWSPIPRLKPEARIGTSYPTSLQRKKVELDEDPSAIIAGGSPIKFSSPTLNKKFSRSSVESPGQYMLSPDAVGNSKKRLRSTTASPKQSNAKMLRFS